MEKVAFFMDYANINRSAFSKGIPLDYRNLLDYMAEGRFLIDAYCYVPIDPRNEHAMDKEIGKLWQDGYMVTTKRGTIAGDTYKCNFDVEMTIDILEIAHTVKPDIVIIAAGDVDLLPVVLQLRKAGIRVEIACFSWAVSQQLLLKCSDFIDLGVYYQETYLPLLDEDLTSDLESGAVEELNTNEENLEN